jgi:tRNA modification GTPase
MSTQSPKTSTIAAIATPTGLGAVGIVRLSGPLSLNIAKKIVKKQIKKPRRACLLPFYDTSDQIIDQGLILFFKAPHSFTGEDIIEFQAHGSPIILNELLHTALHHGARLAKPGEFSQRAFLNGKMDLTQAEAVADLIQATSTKAARSAIHSLQGEFSNHIQQLLNQLTQLRTYIEAALDFSDEEIDFLNDQSIEHSLANMLKTITTIIQSTHQGVLLQEGMRIVIIGKPNAGKSSLLNALSGRESAIVADIAGTTRDVLREFIHIDGMPLHIIDTAGLHKSNHVIEKEAMRRALKEIELADHVLFIQDITSIKSLDDLSILPPNIVDVLEKKPMTVIKNKIDLINQAPKLLCQGEKTTIYLSAKTKTGIDLLRTHLEKCVGFDTGEEGLFIARRRHLNALNAARNYIEHAHVQFTDHSMETLAEDLRLAQIALSKITGQFTTEDLLDEIFSNFCIGK